MVKDSQLARRGTVLGRWRVQRFRGGLVFKAHRFFYHPTLGLRVIKKKKARNLRGGAVLGGVAVSYKRGTPVVRI